MAVLEKIRVKFGIGATIIIAIGLLSFIVSPDDIVSACNSLSSRNDVGEINGKSISYEDFNAEVAKISQITEITTGSSVKSAQQQAQIRDAAWQEIIMRDLFLRNAEKAGISVGDDEKLDLISGPMVSPAIAQNPMFQDEDGNFSAEKVIEFGQSAKDEPMANLYWTYLQNAIFNQQYVSKYNALFTKASIVTPLELKRNIADNNVTNDVEFVMLPYGYKQDTTVVVSQAEIKAYYDNHKKFFSQAESRDIEYVVFDVKPSKTDVEATKDAVAKIYDGFASADNVKAFLSRNASERQFQNYWYKKGELRTVNSKVENFVWDGGKKNVSEVITSGNKFFIARVLDTKQRPDSVYVKHILLQGANAAKADSLLKVLAAGKEKFENVAALYSDDKNSAADGVLGNIGWMTQSYIIPGFEQTIFTAKKDIPYIAKTQYGTHIVAVTKQTKPVEKKLVAIYEKTAQASNETISAAYSQANSFAVIAHNGAEAYHKAADTLGVYSHPQKNMLESTERLGSVENAKEVVRWAFDHKAGDVSDIITIDNKFFIIALVNEVHEEGTSKLSEVAESIRQQLYLQKLGEKKTAEVEAEIEGLDDLEAIAQKLGTSVSTRSGVTFAGAGLDPALIGAVCTAEVGKVSKPIAGSIATYVFKVTARDTGAFFTEDDAKTAATTAAAQASQGILPVMMEEAKVKDHRARFF